MQRCHNSHHVSVICGQIERTSFTANLHFYWLRSVEFEFWLYLNNLPSIPCTYPPHVRMLLHEKWSIGSWSYLTNTPKFIKTQGNINKTTTTEREFGTEKTFNCQLDFVQFHDDLFINQCSCAFRNQGVGNRAISVSPEFTKSMFTC